MSANKFLPFYPSRHFDSNHAPKCFLPDKPLKDCLASCQNDMLLYHVKVCTSLKIQNRRWLFFQLMMNAMPHDNTVHFLQLDHNLVNRVPLHDHTEHFKCYLKKHTSIGLPWWLSGEEPACQRRALRHGFWSLIQEDPTCRRATKPNSHSYWAHGCDHSSPGALGRCSTPREATAMRSLGTTARK